MFPKAKAVVCMGGATILVAVFIFIAVLVRSEGVSAQSVTVEKYHTVSAPKRTGTDVIELKIKGPDGTTETVKVDVMITDTMTASQKAAAYANAIAAALPLRVRAGSALTTVVLAGKNDYSVVGGKVLPKVLHNNLTGSGQKVKEWKSAPSGLSTNSYFEVLGTATGVSLDEEPPIVQVGTARGMAIVQTSPGMSAEVIRDDLLAQLIGLGCTVEPVGPAGMEFTMTSADDDRIIWGQSDSGAFTIGGIFDE